ncbi:hypothetical protein [Chromobacterium sp. CV08]|uniref:hypothetical protein n=1 Tax=Chromobacterium sp. CV08 TaxID=3133274 RepID=UPI003DA990D4
MAIVPVPAKQTDWKLPVATASLASLCSMPDGSVWVGREGQKQGLPGEVYQVEASGTKNTVLLPYPSYVPEPGNNNPAPWPQAICADAGGKLWVAESYYGIVYRIDPGKLAEGKGQAEIFYQSANGHVQGGSPIQFGGLAFQAKSAATGDKDLIWVTDHNRGTLYAFDAAAERNAAPLVQLQLNQDKVVALTAPVLQQGANPVLWLLLIDYQAPIGMPTGAATRLISVPAKIGVKQGDCVSTAFPYAQSLAMRGKTLYAGDMRGTVRVVDITAPARMPQPFATVGQSMSILHLAVDGGGYLWAGNSQDQGLLYALTPRGDIAAAFSLSKGAAEPCPGALVWNARDDTILVADIGDNGRVMQVAMDGGPLGPIGPDGKAHYTISATPETGTTKPEGVFASPGGIKLQAKSTQEGNAPVAAGVQLRVEPADSGGHLGGDGLHRAAAIPIGGYMLTDLTAGTKSVPLQLIAGGRGLEDKVVFTGSIHVPTASIKFEPAGPLRVLQGDSIGSSENVTVRTDPDDGRQVHATIDAGAYFGTAEHPETTRPVNSGAHLPDITAGKTAGMFTLKVKSDDAEGTLNIEVVAVPKSIRCNFSGSLHNVHLASQLSAISFTVRGFKELDKPDSNSVTVPKWPIRVLIADESFKHGVHFPDNSRPNGTRERRLTTDEHGEAHLAPEEMVIPKGLGSITLEFQAAVDLRGNFTDEVRANQSFTVTN